MVCSPFDKAEPSRLFVPTDMFDKDWEKKVPLSPNGMVLLTRLALTACPRAAFLAADERHY